MSQSRQTNLRELSLSEIDDLIKEKSSSLKYTEDKLSKGEPLNSTLRRRDNINSRSTLV